MKTVQNGLFISVNYTGTLDNGDVFDSSEGQLPMEVRMGEGQVIPGFESALMGMSLNEKKTITIQPEDAYGPRNDDFMHTFSRSEVPPEMVVEEGQVIELSTPDGHQIPAMIVEADDEKIVVDMNHPLAGEALTFEIEIVGISDVQTQDPQSCGCSCGDGGCGDSGGCSSDCC